jgi:hypothetical protein
MHRLFPTLPGPLLALSIRGPIGDRETDDIIRHIAAHAQRHGPVRLLVGVEHYPSFNSAEALYEDLRFARLSAPHLERLAVVGDRAWKRTWTALFGLFSGLSTAYFDADQTEEARHWINAGGPPGP